MAELLISGVSRLSRFGSAHPSLSRCISRNRRPCYNLKAESCIKTPEVEAVYVRRTTKTSRMSLPIFLAALKTSTTLGGSALLAPHLSPSAVRGSRHLADGQNRRVILL